ncbi:relaxosome-coupling protein TaxA, partial [Escherichia coli]
KGERFCTVNDPDFRKDVIEVIELCKQIDSKLETLTKSVVNRFG